RSRPAATPAAAVGDCVASPARQGDRGEGGQEVPENGRGDRQRRVDAQRRAEEAAEVGLDERDRADGDQRQQLLPRVEAGDEGVELDEEVLEHERSYRGSGAGDGSTLLGAGAPQ